MGLNKSFFMRLFVCTSLFLLFFNIVSEHCGRFGGGGGMGFSLKNLSKIRSFSRKNTPFDNIKFVTGGRVLINN